MLCTNGHNNDDRSRFCSVCGINTFQPGTAIGVYRSAPGTNSNAIASLVCGLVWVLGVTSVIAIVLGNKARREIRSSGEGGDGMALAGIILGWIGAVGTVLYILFFVLFLAAFIHAAHLCTVTSLGQSINSCP